MDKGESGGGDGRVSAALWAAVVVRVGDVGGDLERRHIARSTDRVEEPPDGVDL